jgi:hypothetical protein
MASLSAYYPLPVVAGTTAGTYAEGDDSRIVGALPAATAGTGSVLASGSNTARTLSARFAERVNVLDFGADPTGTNSSRNALIAAIAAASNNDIIYFPNGTYSGIYDITITKPLSIIGDGPDSTIIDTPNNGSYIFGIGANCTNFTCIGMKIQWEGGYVVQTGGGSRCITNIQGTSNINVSVIVDNCVFRNFSESITLWREKAKNLEVTNCKFLFKHGYAGCRWPSTPTSNIYDALIAGWCIIGNPQTVFIKNNEFNGLEDPTFTGVPSGLEEWIYTPIDNFYKGSGRAYEEIVIENNIIRNFGIEGIIADRNPPSMGTWENNSEESYISKLRIANNTFFGPEKVSIASRGVNPAISVWGGNNVDVCGNYIYGCWTGVVLHNHFKCSVNSTNNTVTWTADSSAFNFVPFQNGKKVRFTALFNESTGISVDFPYYIINCESQSGSSITFQISETEGGSPVDILANASNLVLIPEKEWQAKKINITNNTIQNVISGVTVSFGHSADRVNISGNTINCASDPCKTAQGFFSTNTNNSPPPSYTDLSPIVLLGGANISDNVLSISDPSWDGVFTLDSRGGVSNNEMTLGSGQAAIINAAVQQAAIGDPPSVSLIYGYFTVWNSNGNKVWRWPIESIDVANNKVTIFAGWATNSGADTYTSGPLYWTKTEGSTYLPALYQHYNIGKTITFKNNTIKQSWLDVRPLSTDYGSVSIDGCTFEKLLGGEFPDTKIIRRSSIGLVSLYQGSSIPSISASNGSLFLRTDGDASTTLYIRANGAWEPLAAY